MIRKKRKKSWKERQRDRQIKQQRAQEAYRIQIERAAARKPRKWSKGKMLGAFCLVLLIFGAYEVWRYTASYNFSDESSLHISTLKIIYIRADGSIDPQTAPIKKIGDTYYIFTSKIYGYIIVEKDNIVIDGRGFALQGMFNGTVGIDLTGRLNVTVKNLEVSNFDYGIGLLCASYIVISHNHLTNNYCGIFMVESSNNIISTNNLTSNTKYGIWLQRSNNNTLYRNTIMLNGIYGIYAEFSSGNLIYYNNFINNTAQVYGFASANFWDNETLSMGNHWSDYKERYPDASERDEYGIWDQPYIIDENNQDKYPLLHPCS